MRESEGQCHGYQGLGEPGLAVLGEGGVSRDLKEADVRPSWRVVRTKKGGGVSAGPALWTCSLSQCTPWGG